MRRVNLGFLLALGLAVASHGASAATPSLNDRIVPSVTVGSRAVAAERVLIPTNDGTGRLMAANVFRPVQPGPRPLIVLNHGYTPSESERREFEVPIFHRITPFLLASGYVVVLPRRRGYGPADSVLNEQSDCRNIDFARDGIETARDIAATIEFMARQPYVNKDHVIVIGHSGGGWGVLAAASLNIPGIRAAINLSGGRRCHQDGVDEKTFIANLSRQKLVEAAAVLGRTSRVPTLWVYSANDRNRMPAQITAMREAFVSAGGKAELIMLPPFRDDGHDTISYSEIVAQWYPRVYDFLRMVEKDVKRQGPMAERAAESPVVTR